MATEDPTEMTFRSYLLGQLSASEEESFEKRLMDDDLAFRRAESMVELVEDDLVEDYLRDELSDPERVVFEQRFGNLPRIREKLILINALRERVESGKQATPVHVSAVESREVSRISLWRRRIFRPIPALAASLVLIVLAGGYSAALRISRLENQLISVYSRQTELVSGQEELRAQLDTEQALTGRLVSELEAAIAKSSMLERSLQSLGVRSLSPLASILLSPGLSRSSGQIPALKVSDEHHLVELRLDLGLDEYPSYRASLCDAAGEEIAVQNRLEASRQGDLVLVVSQFPASTLRPGHYLVKLFGTTAQGDAEQLEVYHFRID